MSFARSILFCSAMLAFVADASAVTMSWSYVGNAGNAPDTITPNPGFGSVGYGFNIGTNDVTVRQYVEFLNAKDAGGTNTLFLYNGNMGNAAYGGINFNNLNPAGSMYSVISGRGNHPINAVNWYETIRFANWMNNGQGSGDTETGAYTLGALNPDGTPVTPPLTHNPGSQIWLPTENEWYKAAFYNPSTRSYFQYPTSSNSIPIASSPTGLPNHSNFDNAVGDLTDVGAYTGTTSPYGAFDMGGNVFNWNEELISASRGLRGGSVDTYGLLHSSGRFSTYPATESPVVGFRLASTPEPSTFALAAFGFLGLALWRWRRKR